MWCPGSFLSPGTGGYRPAGSEVFADPLIIKVFLQPVGQRGEILGGRSRPLSSMSGTRTVTRSLSVKTMVQVFRRTKKKEIFERGYVKNSGHGLTLSREILRITGITITENGEPGKGALFGISVLKGMYRSFSRPPHLYRPFLSLRLLFPSHNGWGDGKTMTGYNKTCPG